VVHNLLVFDLIVRGGRVVDPSLDLDTIVELGIIGPRVAAIGTELANQGLGDRVGDATRVIASRVGSTCTPTSTGRRAPRVDADSHCLQRGVTAAVDAGSAGASTFPGLKR
jgi:dihydroorotase